jgi:hypothetical protein
MKKYIFLLLGLSVSACAGKKENAPKITASTAGDLDNLYNTLTTAEGKAVIINTWLKGRNKNE